MAKLSPPNKAVARTTIRIPKSLVGDIRTIMASTGYNPKQRKYWISEAVQSFLKDTACLDILAEEFIRPGSTQPISVELDEAVFVAIDARLAELKQAEGISKERSAFIRSAIITRVLNESGKRINTQRTS